MLSILAFIFYMVLSVFARRQHSLSIQLNSVCLSAVHIVFHLSGFLSYFAIKWRQLESYAVAHDGGE